MSRRFSLLSNGYLEFLGWVKFILKERKLSFWPIQKLCELAFRETWRILFFHKVLLFFSGVRHASNNQILYRRHLYGPFGHFWYFGKCGSYYDTLIHWIRYDAFVQAPSKNDGCIWCYLFGIYFGNLLCIRLVRSLQWIHQTVVNTIFPSNYTGKFN